MIRKDLPIAKLRASASKSNYNPVGVEIHWSPRSISAMVKPFGYTVHLERAMPGDVRLAIHFKWFPLLLPESFAETTVPRA